MIYEMENTETPRAFAAFLLYANHGQAVRESDAMTGLIASALVDGGDTMAEDTAKLGALCLAYLESRE